MGKFELMALPYAPDASVISKETIGFHHGKHLQAYVKRFSQHSLVPSYHKKGSRTTLQTSRQS